MYSCSSAMITRAFPWTSQCLEICSVDDKADGNNHHRGDRGYSDRPGSPGVVISWLIDQVR